jgi:hypothetical protein
LVWTTKEGTAAYGVEGKVIIFLTPIRELPAIVVATEPLTLALYYHPTIWWKILVNCQESPTNELNERNSFFCRQRLSDALKDQKERGHASS